MVADGRLAAQYRMDYGAESYLAHVGAFGESLGWDKALAPRLKRIFGCHDMDEKVALVEEFFGVALRVDARMLEDGAEVFARTRGGMLYREYEARQKRLSKINNRMRAVLTQETDAKLSNAKPCFAVRRATDDEPYDSDMGEALELAGDELRPMLGNLRMRSFSPKIYPGREWVTIADVMGDPLRVSHNGQGLGKVSLPEDAEVAAVLDGGDIIGRCAPWRGTAGRRFHRAAAERAGRRSLAHNAGRHVSPRFCRCGMAQAFTAVSVASAATTVYS